MKYVRHSATGEHWIENIETGHKITQGCQVTIGNSKRIWDVTSILTDGWGAKVELHRQVVSLPPYKRSGVMYRQVEMDRLNWVTPSDETAWSAKEGWTLVRKARLTRKVEAEW